MKSMAEVQSAQTVRVPIAHIERTLRKRARKSAFKVWALRVLAFVRF